MKLNDLDPDTKGPTRRITQKCHKDPEPTFKKPKRPQLSAFSLDKIDEMLKPAKDYIDDKKNNQILDYF